MRIVESSIFNDKIATLDLDYPQFSIKFHKDFSYKKLYKRGSKHFYPLKGPQQLLELKKNFGIAELPYDFYYEGKLIDIINYLR